MSDDAFLDGLPKDAFRRIPPDAVKVEEGMYVREQGDERLLIIDAKEVLLAHGYEATMANQRWIASICQELSDEQDKPMLLRELEKGPPK